MRTSIALVLSFALVLLALPTAPVAAGELKGVTLPDTVDVDGTSLQLNGMALRKAMVFVKVYVAGLYLPEKQSDGTQVLSTDGHRRMVMHFLRGVGADDICGAWKEGLEANTENPSADLQASFDTLCEWTGGAEKDQQYVFTYVPGTGTTVEVAGEVKGTLEGKAFADALFATWIGPNPGPGEGFKNDLLGG